MAIEPMEQLPESSLYTPVRDYLASLGYDVKGEVKNCDITACRDGELIVVELKRGFTLELVYQAMDRQRIADGVYVAVPLPKRGYASPQVRDMQSLCRRLALGLIFVGFSAGGIPQIDVAVHPKEASRPRTDKKRRLAVLREHANRTNAANTGGVTRKKILTAYKEQALLVAGILQASGPLSVFEIKKRGGPENTASIVGRNVLGWFEREAAPGAARYVYRVGPKGLAALEEYRELLAPYFHSLGLRP